MRLIDADALKLSHCVECTLYPDRCLGENCDWDSIYHLEHAPTIDTVKHGKWIADKYTRKCSECESTYWMREGNVWNYCPNCGAKNGGEE